MATILFGASDDLIEVEGSVDEEFNPHDEDEGSLVVFSDGTVLRIVYSRGGVWRITPVVTGPAFERIEQADEDGDATDRAYLGDVQWVVCENRIERAKRTPAPPDAPTNGGEV